MKKVLISSAILIILTIMMTACTLDNEPNTDGNNSPNHTENDGDSNTAEKQNKTNGKDTETIAWPEDYLQKQNEGKPVSQLQQSLTATGYQLDDTGVYDQATTNAITDIQLQLDDIAALGVYNQETQQALEKMNDEALATAITPNEQLSSDQTKPVSGTDEDGTSIIANPYDQLALINKSLALPADYEPDDLVVPDVRFPFDEFLEKKQLREIAADALEDLFAEADNAGHSLFAQSGFRSYDTQISLFNGYAEENGEAAANKYSARPGESEHQSGLTMDITSESVSYRLETDFGDTPEGQWVEQHAADFGFIVRYPKNKADITKYQYEPWHLRYVGEQTAQTVMSEDLVLEEYLNADN